METPNKTTFVKLTDLEAELREINSMITRDTPLNPMPNEFLMKCVDKRVHIDAKKEEIQKQINSLVDNKSFSMKDAQPFSAIIDSLDLDLNGPVYGYDCFHSFSLPLPLMMIDFYNPPMKSE